MRESARPKRVAAGPARRPPPPRVTERVNPATAGIDRLGTLEVVRRINDQDLLVAPAVRKVAPMLAKVVDRIVEAFGHGGRLLYAGAGTSGRLGVLDASECPPTFSTPPYLVQGILAGGDVALKSSVEGAEDDPEAARLLLRERGLMREDVVVAIAASGSTPFARGALQEAKSVGAGTVLVTCNPRAELAALADFTIAPNVGPEAIAGSTRMKAGTATKLVLNTLTTAAMVRWGKVYGNRMVDVRPVCAKLVARARRLIADLAGVDDARAAALLEQSGGRVKVAVVMHRRECDRKRAEALLAEAKGFLRDVLEPAAHAARRRGAKKR